MRGVVFEEPSCCTTLLGKVAHNVPYFLWSRRVLGGWRHVRHSVENCLPQCGVLVLLEVGQEPFVHPIRDAPETASRLIGETVYTGDKTANADDRTGGAGDAREETCCDVASAPYKAGRLRLWSRPHGTNELITELVGESVLGPLLRLLDGPALLFGETIHAGNTTCLCDSRSLRRVQRVHRLLLYEQSAVFLRHVVPNGRPISGCDAGWYRRDIT